MDLPLLPSVDDMVPSEEGGPIARSGFDYQDEIGVSFLLDMLEDTAIQKIHFETHDDLVIVLAAEPCAIAEFVQVKAGEINQLWTVAAICKNENGAGTSIMERSLGRDSCREQSRFRLVTLRQVASELKPLTYPRDAPGRQLTEPAMAALLKAFEEKKLTCVSKKDNRVEFWVANCLWQERPNESAIRELNFSRLMRLANRRGFSLFSEQADQLLEDLRLWVKRAGAARWRSNRKQKIVTRSQICSWLDRRLAELRSGIASPSGGKLAGKMEEAGLSEEQAKMAIDLRLSYSRVVRTSRYMTTKNADKLQLRVKSELASLRARMMAGQLQLNGQEFHKNHR
jgi:Cap4 dsDNA endonuclease